MSQKLWIQPQTEVDETFVDNLNVSQRMTKRKKESETYFLQYRIVYEHTRLLCGSETASNQHATSRVENF